MNVAPPPHLSPTAKAGLDVLLGCSRPYVRFIFSEWICSQPYHPRLDAKQQRPAGLLNAPLRLYSFMLPLSNNAFNHNSLGPTCRHPGHSYGHLPGSYQNSCWRMLDDVSINSRYDQFTRVRRHHRRRCNSSVGRAERLTAYSRPASRGRFDAIGVKGATCLSTESTMYRTSQLKTSIRPQLTRTACVVPWDNRLVVAYDATRWICIEDIGIRQHIFFCPPIRPCQVGRCVVLGAACSKPDAVRVTDIRYLVFERWKPGQG